MKRLGVALILGLMVTACTLNEENVLQQQITATPTPEPTETIPPYTPLPSLTPSQTLRPPPTFEPPTLTPRPSQTPSMTPSPTIDLSVSIPGLRGAETPTPESTPGCEPREDWGLRYTVQRGDALARIAAQYSTYASVLAEANCLDDPNLIVEGQVLRVPGEAHPATPEYVCVPWELLTPFNGSVTVPATGQLTFNWRGPESPRYLIRIYKPDGATHEILVELRTNETIDLAELPQGGLYRWQVYPIGHDFLQIPCKESYTAQFVKAELPGP